MDRSILDPFRGVKRLAAVASRSIVMLVALCSVSSSLSCCRSRRADAAVENAAGKTDACFSTGAGVWLPAADRGQGIPP